MRNTSVQKCATDTNTTIQIAFGICKMTISDSCPFPHPPPSELIPRRFQQLQLTLPADVHKCADVHSTEKRRLAEMHLFVSVVDSCAFLNPIREFWSRKGWHNRIRHVDPPKGNLFQERKLRNKPQPMIRIPHAHEKCATVYKCELLGSQNA